MRSLYAEKNVGTSTEVACKFTQIRDETRNDAKVYLKVILPLTTKFVSSIKFFFEFCEAISYHEWHDMLPRIVTKVKDLKELVETLKSLHEDLLGNLNKREDDAKITITKFKNLQSEFEKKTKQFENKATYRYMWANFLAFIPGVNLIAYPLLKLSADEYYAQALAMAAESETQKAAALVVSETLIPALSQFIEGLCKAAGFLQTLEEELESPENSREADCEKVYFRMMKSNAKRIQPSVYKFYASLPTVRADFNAIPDEGTDQNYIEEWLNEKLRMISLKRMSTQEAWWDVVKRMTEFVIRPQLCESPASANNE